MSNLGTLIVPEIQLLDDNGNPLNGGKLYAYAAGTTTPQNTYSDAALTTPNANPVILDSAGRALVYLDNLAYKFIVQTSAGVQVGDTVDPYYPPGYVASQAVQSYIPQACQGRLTLTSGVPVTTSDVTAATTVYFTPYKGNVIGLYDGTSWQLITFTEKSLSIAGFAASTPFDVWGRISSGALAIDSTAWTNDTTRATALTTQDGVYVKSGDTTRRYLGTFRTTGTVGQTEDSVAKRFCWNYANRVARPLLHSTTDSSWTYSSATVRQANANTANQVELCVGVLEDQIALELRIAISQASAGAIVSFGIGADSTTAFTAAENIDTRGGANLLSNIFSGNVVYKAFPSSVGRHFYSWNEANASAAGTTTWEGTVLGAGFPIGLSGTVFG